MKWSTHQRILSRVLSCFHSDEQLLYQAREGSIAPDKVIKDYYDHRFNENGLKKIRFHIQKARSMFLINRISDAYYELGVASHYIADGMTAVHLHDVSSKDPIHEQYESDLDDLDKNEGFSLLRDVYKEQQIEIMGPADIKEITDYMKKRRLNAKNVRDWYPHDDLYLTYYFLNILSVNILSDKYPPTKEQEYLKKLLISWIYPRTFAYHSLKLVICTILALFLWSWSPFIGIIAMIINVYYNINYFLIANAIKNKKTLYVYRINGNEYKFSRIPDKSWFILDSSKF
jgi:hypothetical protein